uniref:Uncharacterized protein n=1 Tax=viral metagenome TaxID=1070528 RepID=A0A6M3IXH8_9ZZZZ
MKKIVFGLIIGLTISGVCYGYRITKPSRVTDFDSNNLITVNQNFERLWDLTNGRYSLNIVTTNPDGSRGDVGDMVLLNATGTYYLEICVATNTWRGVELTNVP